MNKLLLTVLTVALSVALLACDDGDGNTPVPDAGTDSGMDVSTGGSELLSVPSLQPMGFGDQVAICHDTNGSWHFSSNPAGLCPFAPPGTTIVPSFLFNPGSQSLTAGETMVSGSATAVQLASTTGGTLVDDAPDRVDGIPVATSITVETDAYRLEFSFPDDTSVEITSFTKLP